MSRKLVLAIVLALFLVCMLGGSFEVRKVEASETIYIRANGLVEGTDKIITADNVTYTFTDNINGSIFIERDNIVVDGAGYTLQGTGSGYGIELSYRSNVTIKNMEIKNFEISILLSFTSDNTISGNKITAFDSCGIYMNLSAPHNTISGNTITAPSKQGRKGIFLGQTSGNNIISGNYIDGFYEYGIMSEGSSNNIISGNTIRDTLNGIWLVGGSNNRIYHNNFIGHPQDCYCPLSTTLDAGYPLGGNYWDKYNGADLFSGQYQDEPGSDGIGDTPYWGQRDIYPLMGMFSDFKATSEYHVQTICNSSIVVVGAVIGISDFHFNGTAISFNVTGETDSTGFCRICIPRALMNETYQVFVNGTEVPCNLLPCSSTTHSYLYFTYNHSTQEVIVRARDTSPPNITDVSQFPFKNNVLPEDEVLVNATVTDDLSGVKQVALNYTNGDGTWIIVEMTNLEGNIWNGTIPAFEYCTYVNYTIVAEDENGNSITTEGILGYQYQYHVIPELPTWTSMLLILIVLSVALAIYKRRLLKKPVH